MYLRSLRVVSGLLLGGGEAGGGGGAAASASLLLGALATALATLGAGGGKGSTLALPAPLPRLGAAVGAGVGGALALLPPPGACGMGGGGGSTFGASGQQPSVQAGSSSFGGDFNGRTRFGTNGGGTAFGVTTQPFGACGGGRLRPWCHQPSPVPATMGFGLSGGPPVARPRQSFGRTAAGRAFEPPVGLPPPPEAGPELDDSAELLRVVVGTAALGGALGLGAIATLLPAGAELGLGAVAALLPPANQPHRVGDELLWLAAWRAASSFSSSRLAYVYC